MELLVERDYRRSSVSFFLRSRSGTSTIFLGQKDGKILEQKISHNSVAEEEILPLLELPIDLADTFIKEVSKYASDNGIRTENENLLKGKLEATEKHLSDFRELLPKLLNKVLTQ